MYRGTTPELKFELPFNASELTLLSIAFEQEGRVIIEKKLADCECSGKTVSVKLSEADTLEFNHNAKLNMQLRCGIGDKRIASDIISTSVGRILKEGELQ